MNKELMEALDILEKEKEISKETLFDAIENSLITACKNHFGKADNIKVEIDRETCDFLCYAEKEVVEEVEDDCLQISLTDALKISRRAQLGNIVHVEIKSKEFGRIATQNAKNVILQKIREEERSVIYNQYYEKEKDVVTGIVQRYLGKNISINLGKADGIMNESEQVKGEIFKPTERIKVYILEVKNTPKGPRILVSRTHPELVKRLFEAEVTEIKDGTVEIRSIAREPGSRTKMAVWSNNPNVDAVGACVGINGSRVNTIVEELRGEKIDIINWDDNPGNLIQNALSPAKIVAVFADPDEKTAKVVVPDYQLSLAIGKEGQNARLAARLTGYKIDIKSETQAKDAPGFRYEDYLEDYDEYDGEYEGEEADAFENGEGGADGETVHDTAEADFARDGADEDSFPQDEVSEEALPEERMDEKSSAEDGADEEISLEDGMSEEGLPEERVDEESFAEDGADEENFPEDGMSEEALPEERVDEENFPEDGMSEEGLPEERMDEESSAEDGMDKESLTGDGIEERFVEDGMEGNIDKGSATDAIVDVGEMTQGGIEDSETEDGEIAESGEEGGETEAANWPKEEDGKTEE